MSSNVIVGSLSERKISQVREIFEERLPSVSVMGVEADSGFSDSPTGGDTYLGAKNRALFAAEQIKASDWAVGIESGLIERCGSLYEETWCVIVHENELFSAYSSGLAVPKIIVERMQKEEHWQIMDSLEQELNLPHDTWANYTGGLIQRHVSIREAIRNCAYNCLPLPNSLYRLR
jgi:inosine/xanthosine triphosphatase